MEEFVIEGISNGGTKKDVNQDACFAGQTKVGEYEAVFVAVCDGMGGIQSGELASATIIEEARNWFYSKCDLKEKWEILEEKIFDEWERLLQRCNEKIIRYGTQNGIKLGSTAAFILLWGGRVFVSNIGDTRIYELPADGELRRLSKDHSVVGNEIAAGKITEEEAKTDKRNNILTQCIGYYPQITPFFRSEEIVRQGIYFVSSDGFYNKVRNEEIVRSLKNGKCNTEEILSSALIDLVEKDRERGEHDDITVVAVYVENERE